MGIQGLLPLLKSIEKPVHLKDYAGKTLAVDGYVWLHKGAFACAQELCLSQDTDKYITYFMRKIEMFKFFGVKPYVVFDGGYLPSKALTEQDRLARREESKKQAMDLLQAGKSRQALEQFRRCVDVTPEMAHAVIQALKTEQVDYVVAPYEADAQLAYLEKKGLVDGIVTEDSDLLVFGCKRVIFKLDQYGAGIEILHKNLNLVRDVSFHEWTMTEIRHMCILAGCDYLPSISGMGLKTAQRLLRRFKTFERAIKYIRMENTGAKIQADYEDSFRKADLTFLYARVYDPVSKSMVHLNPVPEELEDLIQSEEYDFLGPLLEEPIVRGIATGRLDPISKKPLSCPSVQCSTVKPVQLFAGKENKAVQQSAKTTNTTMAATKSIHTYFEKAATPPSKQQAPIKEMSQMGEVLKKAGSTAKKRTLEEGSFPERLPLATKSLTSTSPLHLSSFALQRQSVTMESKRGGAVVEARSRFFGFEATVTSTDEDTLTNKRRHANAVREDSGVGLDEALLLRDPSIFNSRLESTPKRAPRTIHSRRLSSPKHGSLSKSGTATSILTETSTRVITTLEAFETKKAEAKVIQGWREKFSNALSHSSQGTSGLTRAFQMSKPAKKSMPVSSLQTSTLNKSIDLTTNFLRSPVAHPSHLHSTAATTRITNHAIKQVGSCHPSNVMQHSNCTSTSTAATVKLPKSNKRRLSGGCGLSQSRDDISVSSTTLDLSRFKYTPASTASLAVPATALSP
ncbi:Rad2 nuclease [Mortierella claussenii]|nr:Rad2 nuclease [Mortierella claussenii]